MASQTKNRTATQSSSRTYDPWDLLAKEQHEPPSEVQQAQTRIYTIFLKLAKTLQPEDVLSLFRQIFIYCVDSSESNLTPAIYTILRLGEEKDFHHTLHRVCYILINNWETSRHQHAVLNLMDLLTQVANLKEAASPQLRVLRQWLATFLASQSFKELKVYALRYIHSSHWTNRYTSYLLTSQSLNQDNPDDQRRVANLASGNLKRTFKRNLAMYTIQADKPLKSADAPANPTLLGENILPLIKKILAKQGEFNSRNLANIFLAQSQDLKFKQFKQGLSDYLVFSMGSHDIIAALKKHLSRHLNSLYSHYDDQQVDQAIILRTANQIIEFLTIDRQNVPSSLMVLLLSKGYALTLAILLLKVIMISPKSRRYLEAKIGDLVNYYGDCPKEECQWLIQFLEILNVTLTIHSDQSVNYSLVPVGKTGRARQAEKTPPACHSQSSKQSQQPHSQGALEALAVDSYRIFACRVDGSTL